jgi:hypothetical protein
MNCRTTSNDTYTLFLLKITLYKKLNECFGMFTVAYCTLIQCTKPTVPTSAGHNVFDGTYTHTSWTLIWSI